MVRRNDPSPLREEVEASTTSSPLHSWLEFGTSEVLHHVRNLTDVGAMTRLLHHCIAYQRTIDVGLDNLLSPHTDLDKQLDYVMHSFEVLEIVKSDAYSLLSSVFCSSDLADRISAKVRELDLAKGRVKSTLLRIDAIVERGNCIEGVKSALSVGEYEVAAKCVETFLEIDKKFKDLGSEQREEMMVSKKELEEIVRKRMAGAVDREDHVGLVRFVRLYPLLGMKEEGLQVYVGYLKKIISGRSKVDFEKLDENVIDFVGYVRNLLKEIVLGIEENDEILRWVCGDFGVVYAVSELQSEFDSMWFLICKKFMEFRKLSKIASDINVLGVGSVERPDPRDIELYIDEVLLFVQLGKDYMDYMTSKIRGLSSVNPELVVKVAKSFKCGNLNGVIQDIVGFYVILEGYFMVENVKKAIRIDEHVLDNLTTTMVDDVFYVLQSCLTRAFSTANISSVIAILSGASSLLSNEYLEALQMKIREPCLGTKLFVGGLRVAKTGREIATALNNTDVSCQYVVMLKQEMEEQCGEAFPTPADREKAKSCLLELNDLNSTFKQYLNTGMEQLLAMTTPQIRPVLDSIATVAYDISEVEYTENEVNDPWVLRLLHVLEAHIPWLQPLMTANNYDSLIHRVIDFITKRLEVIMMQKKFSQLGALQFDKDTRALMTHFSGITQRTVRDKFARLTQMATILNLEKVCEILDFWGENSGPVTWRLTPAEVRRVLGLRVDFKLDSISSLKL